MFRVILNFTKFTSLPSLSPYVYVISYIDYSFLLCFNEYQRLFNITELDLIVLVLFLFVYPLFPLHDRDTCHQNLEDIIMV